MKAVIPLLVLAIALLAWLVLFKYLRGRLQQQDLVTLALRFPRDLSAEATEQFLAGTAGVLPPWWKRWLSTPSVVLETIGDARGIEHRLAVPSGWLGVIEHNLQATVPSLRYDIFDHASPRISEAAEYRLSSSTRPLRVEAADLSAKLLSSLQPLGPGERIVVQWIITPHAPVAPVRIATKADRDRWWSPPWPGQQVVASAEEANALRAKHDRPLHLAVGRIGVGTDDLRRGRQLLRQVEVAWHGSRAPGVHLRRRLLSSRTVCRRLRDRVAPVFDWPAVLNTQELAGLLGWPIGAVQLPGLRLGSCRLVAAATVIPSSGSVIGESTFPGSRRPLALDIEARLRHVHVLGPTGTGKSTLLVNMVTSDLVAGRGVVVIDPKGDLVDDVLDRVPQDRREDVVVLDPADIDRPVGLNPMAAAPGAGGEVVIENLVGLFKNLYRSSWGPRTDDILRAALMTLAGSPGATLCEVPSLLTNPGYRRRLVGALNDPVGLESFWGWYEALSDAEKLNVTGPVMNKLRAFLMRPSVRAIVGQAEPKWNLRRFLAEKRILLVSLASGLLGEEAAHLLGALVVAELWHATKSRAALPASERSPVMAYLDEWQNLLHLPTPMASVLAEARGLGLGLTLAHQSLTQVPTDARDAIMSNARSRVCFQLPSSDARLVARDLGGVLTADDLINLGAYEIMLSAFAGGSTQAPATAVTRPMPPTCSSGAEIRRVSRTRFGVDRGDVDAQIRARQHGGGDPPVRRKRTEGPGRTS